MVPQLVAKTEGPNILLDKPILLIGRHQECDIQIASRKISRKHCCIAQVNDYLVIRDLQSTNGIRINGERVVEGSLHAGDEITIGNFLYEVRFENGAAPQANGNANGNGNGHAKKKGRDPLESCEQPMPLEEPSKNGEHIPRAGVPKPSFKFPEPPPLPPDEMPSTKTK